MERPCNIDLPFFAYGLFRPGQLAFFQLRDFVKEVTDPSKIAGCLRLRDGLPLLDPQEKGFVRGALITFLPDRASEAYDRISSMEPDKHYRWDIHNVDGKTVNVLVGQSPRKGSEMFEENDWNGWDDPLFTAALDVVEETLMSEVFHWNLKSLFRLQMAYLLLWSSIERYVSLRYHLGDKVSEKVKQLASEPAFSENLQRHVKSTREVYRADRPKKREVIDPNSPEKSINYYYQVRSNIVHRGKGVSRDYDLLQESLTELLSIFRGVLKAAEADAR